MLKAGAGRAEIILPPELFPFEGLSAQQHPLHVRVLLLEAGVPFVLVSLELTSLRDYALSRLRAAVAGTPGLAGLAPHQIWMTVTHTFCAPHTRSPQALQAGGPALCRQNEQLCQALEAAARQATAQAVQSLRPAVLAAGYGRCALAVNRDVPTAAGWWLGQNPGGYTDPALPVLCLEQPDGSPLAIVFSCDMQPAVMSGTPLVTPDVTGAACRRLEQRFPGSVAVSLLGAAGDQAPRFQLSQTPQLPLGRAFADMETLAGELADAVAQAMGCAAPQAVEQITFRQVSTLCPGQQNPPTQALRPTRSYCYRPAPERTATAELVRLGGLTLAGVKPELCSKTGHALRQGGVFLAATMVNGGEKYMPDAASYDRMTYEAMNAPYGRGSAERLTQAILSALHPNAGGKP